MDVASGLKSDRFAIRLLRVLVLCLSGVSLFAARAFALTGPPGLYVLVDPYNQNSLANLQAEAAAATTALNQNATTCSAASGVEPFCSSANGILLDVDWCRFQGYPDNSAPLSGTNRPELSCH